MVAHLTKGLPWLHFPRLLPICTPCTPSLHVVYTPPQESLLSCNAGFLLFCSLLSTAPEYPQTNPTWETKFNRTSPLTHTKSWSQP